VLQHFPENCPPTLVTQHMPPLFTRSLASRLDRMCKPTVREASHGAPLAPGVVCIAPGGEQHLEISGRTTFSCVLKAGPAVNGHCPSVDRLFASVARTAGRAAVGVVLTGMGRDGAQGLLEMRQAGARTIGQDEASSVVYGMPKAAFENGAVEQQLDLARIGPAVLEATAMRT
jgi:two-component system chemotaxis response regulator CheB